MKLIVIHLIFTLYIIASIESSTRRFNFVLTEYFCKNFTSLARFSNCGFITPDKPNIFYLNQQAVFERDLGTKFYVRIWFHFRQGSMRNSIRIMDLKFKFCDIWDGSTENRLLKTILSEVRRTSNLPHMCPVKGNFLYKMENFTVTDKFVPTYAPFMNFTVALEFLENDKLFAITKVSGAVAPK